MHSRYILSVVRQVAALDTPPSRRLALDLRAARDAVGAVVAEPHPRLVAPVVVRRPEHEGGLAAPHRARIVPLGVETAPDPHERVVLALLARRRRLAVAGMHDGLGRQA